MLNKMLKTDVFSFHVSLRILSETLSALMKILCFYHVWSSNRWAHVLSSNYNIHLHKVSKFCLDLIRYEKSP